MQAQAIHARTIKTTIMGHALNHLQHIGAFTECFYGNCDVFSINKNLYGFDYEVKVDKYDLINEIKAVQAVLTGNTWAKVTSSKYHKHAKYLRPFQGLVNYETANYFYFVVPEELEAVALEGVQNTNYGVISLKPHVFYAKRAKLLHKNKIEVSTVISLLRKASFETYNLRYKYL